MRIHVVDGTYELFRAWFGAPESRTADGREVGALRGLARSLLALVRSEGATHVGVAFDHTVESFRNELFAGYKTGEGLDPELFAQFEPAERLTAALGMVVWPMVEFEADDALAAAAARFADESQVEQVLICTPDKDLAQSVRGDRVVMRDRRRARTLNEAAVLEKYGVLPTSIPDWLALVGDTADGIPGVPRWGARSSAIALGAYGHVAAIPDDPARWTFKIRGADTLARNLVAHRQQVELYRELATLRLDVPMTESTSDLEWRGAHRDAVRRIAAELEDQRLEERVPRWID